MAKPYDVVVYGATGYTGSLVASYLYRVYGLGGSLRWAIAGRSKEKLQALSREILEGKGDLSSLPIITANSTDEKSLEAMVDTTKVVISTVGPYAIHGTKLVGAAARKGVDYVDLTGEAIWVRRMIDQFDGVARQTGARIVHSCGFDSIPFDLGALAGADHLLRRWNLKTRKVETFLTKGKGGVSGGTIASMVNMLGEMSTDLKKMRQPYYLNPAGEDLSSLPDKADPIYGVNFHPKLGRWTSFFIMAPFNTRIVRRTHALLGYKYGTFSYSEAAATSPARGIMGYLANRLQSWALLAAVALMACRPLRSLALRALPPPGQGPSKESLPKGYMEARVFAESEPDEGSGRLHTAVVMVSGQGDPGYLITSAMLAESAVCLAMDRVPAAGGSHTSGSAMGMALVDRLNRQNVLRFEVKDLE